MRIGIVAPPWAPIPPDGYGGIEVVVHDLAVGLKRAGHDVLLFTTGDSTCPVPRQWALAKAEGMRIGEVLPELRHVLQAYEAMVGAGVDLVHDHTLAGPVHARSFPGLPVVTTIHGPLDRELADLYRRLEDRAAVVAVSRDQREAAPDVDVTAVIHHGLDAGGFPMGSGTGGYCLFLGRMSRDKGAHRAIRVAERVGIPLVLVGKMRTAAEVDYFRTEVEPHLGDRIWHLGEVSHNRKVELLGKAACLLFPIRWREPFGMVMLEAMACGTPVLAFGEGAAREVVQHGRTGFLCEDEQDMASAVGELHRLARDDCRAAVEGYFSADRMVAEHVELFEKLL